MSSNNDKKVLLLHLLNLAIFLLLHQKHLGVWYGDSLNVFMTTYRLNYAKLSTTSFEKKFLLIGNISQGSNHPKVLKLENQFYWLTK